MDLTIIIQVAIGIIFVWIALAMINSQVQDWISSALSWRALTLEQAIGNMLGNEEFRKQFYNHPLIQGLHSNGGKRKPAGIPADKFTLVVLERIIEAGKNKDEIKSSFENLKQGVEKLKNQEGFQDIAGSLDTLLLGIENKAEETEAAFNEARQRMEGWFNNAMERLTGAYRRRMQIVAIIVGILVAAVINADSASIASKLWIDPAVRDAVVAQASQTQAPDQQAGQTPNTQEILSQLKGLSIPIGWSAENMPATNDFKGWGTKIAGILISGLASAQGAPFWFELMRKLLNRG